MSDVIRLLLPNQWTLMESQDEWEGAVSDDPDSFPDEFPCLVCPIETDEGTYHVLVYRHHAETLLDDSYTIEFEWDEDE